jgi:hypothetical protein
MFIARRRREQHGGSFDAQILALFAAGEQGAWYDPSDMSSMFQDTGGTIPVNAIGQRVARINDKSGRGNHATQATAANQPFLQIDGSGRLYLDFTAHLLTTAAINFTAGDKMTFGAGVRKNSDAATGILIEMGNGGSLGSFAVQSPQTALANYGFNLVGTTAAFRIASTFTSPITNVVSCQFDIGATGSAAEILPRVNGAVPTLSAGSDSGTGNFGTWALNLGARTAVSNPLNGRVYGAVVRAALSSAAQVLSIESWCNSKAGAF